MTGPIHRGPERRGGTGQIGQIGLLGGTFNPIHIGHLRAAEEVMERLDLARVVFVPSASPPHKQPSVSEGSLAPAADRLKWVELATASNPSFEVDSIEMDRGGRSYTVETLRSLRARGSDEAPVFIIGRDAFRDLGTWREPVALLTLAHFAVVSRPPDSDGRLIDWLPESLRDQVEFAPDGRSARHREAQTWLRHLEITALDVSASDIRQRLRAAGSIRYLVPESIRGSVEGCANYRGEQRQGAAANSNGECGSDGECG